MYTNIHDSLYFNFIANIIYYTNIQYFDHVMTEILNLFGFVALKSSDQYSFVFN